MKRSAAQALQDERAKLEKDRERKVAAIDRAKQRRAEAHAEVVRLGDEQGEIVLAIARVDRALASLDGWQGETNAPETVPETLVTMSEPEP